MKRSSQRRQVVRNLVAWLVAGVLLALVVVVAGWRPRVEYVLALAILGAIATAALQRVGSTTVEAMWPSPIPPGPVVPGIDPRTNAVETLMRRSVEDEAIFERRLRPLLEDLAAHRLRRNHGVELSDPSDEARRLLGDETWTLITTPGARRVSAARIERAVASIERL